MNYDKARSAFEHWCWNDTPESANFSIIRNAVGGYASEQTDGAWLAWLHMAEQAERAALEAEVRHDRMLESIHMQAEMIAAYEHNRAQLDIDVEAERKLFENAMLGGDFARVPVLSGYSGYADSKEELAFFGWILSRYSQIEVSKRGGVNVEST